MILAGSSGNASTGDRSGPASKVVYRRLCIATILKWNGKDVPDKLRKLPEGRYVIESVDAVPALTAEEE